MLLESPPVVPAEFETVLMACPAMGTRFELVLIGPDGVRLHAGGEAAVEEIQHWHRRLSWFDRGSFLSFVNTHAATRAIECDGEFFELLLLCGEVWRASQGAFDPTVAALMRASGFRDIARDPDAIAEAVRAVGFDKVELDESHRTIRYLRTGLGMDFGAVGKGWALDRARVVLANAGLTTALLHGGTSSVLALGAPPGQSGWSVTIGRRPDAPSVVLCNSALGVSAPHGRVVESTGGFHGHVLDPRSGRSARGGALAAVVADSAALADAWLTALLVEGQRPEGMPAHMTSMVAPSAAGGTGWQINGPQANTLCTRPDHGSVPVHQLDKEVP